MLSLGVPLTHCFTDSSNIETPDDKNERLKEELNDNVEMCSVILLLREGYKVRKQKIVWKFPNLGLTPPPPTEVWKFITYFF